MNPRSCFRTLLVVVALIFCASTVMASSLPENKPGKGDPSPTFSIPDLKGNKVVLADILKSGKIVFLNFWGIRCSSCVEEIGYLNPLFEKYAPKGVVFLGVNVDGAKPEMIIKLMPNMQNQPKYTLIPDPQFKVPDMFNMAGAPLSFIIGKDGIIQYRHEDFKPGDEVEIEEAIKKAIAGN